MNHTAYAPSASRVLPSLRILPVAALRAELEAFHDAVEAAFIEAFDASAEDRAWGAAINNEILCRIG